MTTINLTLESTESLIATAREYDEETNALIRAFVREIRRELYRRVRDDSTSSADKGRINRFLGGMDNMSATEWDIYTR